MKVGDFVRLKVPENKKFDASARGRVRGVERYEDAHGVRNTVYVRWYSADGKPDDGVIVHSRDELEVVEDEQ